ncbi:capsule biosynthesis protein [Psychrobacter sp. SCQQ22]|uniref:capsule biosynthesis protein n=1 Tax=Psychrobacter sp. SCQQ22 TaxID=2792059 RepID=UPI0018CEF29E|nr:capsule biosynthesis protein [Psychrobacter sp. SCQQ22]MBH0085079.1 capsule biosynthesis protein [Psychrobacter sp. SCQQ22]
MKSISTKQKSKVISFSLFTGLVIIPWVLVIFYVITLAHPRFISTADVVVKQVSDTTTASGGGLSALLGVNSTSKEDATYLTEYILSNDMVKRLDKKFKFREAYHIDGSDPINELKPDATQEELLEYFKKRVHIDLDEQSYILSVSTEGFDSKYAFELNKTILDESEQFVNRISQEVARDQLVFAETQLDESEKRLNEKKEKLLNYQNDNEIYDPEANAQIVNQLIGSLQAQLSSLRTEERQLLSYLNPDAPQVVSLRSQIKAIEEQTRQEQTKLTSPNTSKLNRQAVEFETIKADVEFATELYKLSLSSLETARLEAFKKMKNLIVISTPYEAEEALYPRRGYIIWTSLALLLILYGFVRLVMAVVRDHRS